MANEIYSLDCNLKSLIRKIYRKQNVLIIYNYPNKIKYPDA